MWAPALAWAPAWAPALAWAPAWGPAWAPAWAPAWDHFWGLSRPDGPTADDFVAVLRELGLDPEIEVSRRGSLSVAAADPEVFVPTTRRRLCLPAERDAEIAEWLADHPPPFVEQVATVRWPGVADPLL